MSGVFNALVTPDVSEQIFLYSVFILCFTKICKIDIMFPKVGKISFADAINGAATSIAAKEKTQFL